MRLGGTCEYGQNGGRPSLEEEASVSGRTHIRTRTLALSKAAAHGEEYHHS